MTGDTGRWWSAVVVKREVDDSVVATVCCSLYGGALVALSVWICTSMWYMEWVVRGWANEIFPCIHLIRLRQHVHAKYLFSCDLCWLKVFVMFILNNVCTCAYILANNPANDTCTSQTNQSGKRWVCCCCCCFFLDWPRMLAHAYILSACTRVRSYLYQRAILHSSGKGQSKRPPSQ